MGEEHRISFSALGDGHFDNLCILVRAKRVWLVCPVIEVSKPKVRSGKSEKKNKIIIIIKNGLSINNHDGDSFGAFGSDDGECTKRTCQSSEVGPFAYWLMACLVLL